MGESSESSDRSLSSDGLSSASSDSSGSSESTGSFPYPFAPFHTSGDIPPDHSATDAPFRALPDLDDEAEAKDAKQDHDTVVRISVVNITNSDQTYAVISSSFDFFFSETDAHGLSVERIGGKPAYRSTIHLRDFRVIPPGGAYVVEVNLSRRHNMNSGFYKLVVRKPLDLREGFIGEYDERRTRGTIDAAPLDFEVRP